MVFEYAPKYLNLKVLSRCFFLSSLFFDLGLIGKKGIIKKNRSGASKKYTEFTITASYIANSSTILIYAVYMQYNLPTSWDYYNE